MQTFTVAVAATVEGTSILKLTSEAEVVEGDDIQIEPTMSGITESTPQTLLATKEAASSASRASAKN